MTRVLVTGSRDLTDTDLVYEALSELFHEAADGEFIVVHGGARGADRMAHQWAQLSRRYGVREEVHNADWTTHTAACPASHRGQRVCKLAGRRRNDEMIATKPDVVVAFFREGAANAGTTHCRDAARVAGVPVVEYTQA